MTSEESSVDKLSRLCSDLAQSARSPVLVMYYADNGGSIIDDDVEALYSHLRSSGLSTTKPLESLSIILHTNGGSPDAAYQLARVIRRFADYVYILIPFKAASAGTILSFCGNKIYLGATAFITAIDISVGEIELASIIKYIKFALDSRED